MKTYKWVFVLSILAIVMLAMGTAVAADNNVIKVGKKGSVTLDKETMLGDVTLKPGSYTLQHRVQGEEHVVAFKPQNGTAPIEAKCRLEPLKSKVSQTSVTTTQDGGMQRIVEVKIAGENVAHVF